MLEYDVSALLLLCVVVVAHLLLQPPPVAVSAFGESDAPQWVGFMELDNTSKDR